MTLLFVSASSTFPFPFPPRPGILIGSLNVPDSFASFFLREGRVDHSASGSEPLNAYASLWSVLAGWVGLVRDGEGCLGGVKVVETGGGVCRLRLAGLSSMRGERSSAGGEVLEDFEI